MFHPAIPTITALKILTKPVITGLIDIRRGDLGFLPNRTTPSLDHLLKKAVAQQNKSTRLTVLIAVIGLLFFLSAAAFLPFKDNLFSLLYPKPESKAADLLSEQLIYDDALTKPGFWWSEWGATTHPALITATNSAQVASGTYSMELNLNDWTVIWLYKSDRANGCDTRENGCPYLQFPAGDYTDIEFDVYGIPPFLPKVYVQAASNPWTPVGLTKAAVGPDAAVTSLISAWQHVKISIADLGIDPSTLITGFGIHLREPNAGGYGNILIDNIKFTKYNYPSPTPQPTQNFNANIDANANNRPISSFIYGLSTSGGSVPYYKDMGVSLVRWGGNARTRHNWEINASNAGSDWEFRNRNQAGGSIVAGKASVDFVNSNRNVGAESYLTIPMIGWVAKDGNNNTLSTGVPPEGGLPATAGSDVARLCSGVAYDPTNNRNTTSIPSFAKKGSAFTLNPDSADGKVYQDEWVNYLKNTLGDARGTDPNDPTKHGVRFYAMDNELDLWADNTHLDVHPVRAGYDESLDKFLEYSEAVKAVDPSAEIMGGVGWGWLSLWYSALDRGCNSFGTHADRQAHSNLPFYQWFLQEIKKHDDTVGHRTLDILDTHYGPQGSNLTDDRRLRAVRSWWDPTYAEESWMGNTEGGPYLQVIPRLKSWINQYYPGTKLGFSEWYDMMGIENQFISSLLAADVLGIFGREDVYFATFWGQPPDKSPTYWAWRMFRNTDGNFTGFGDTVVKTDLTDPYAGGSQGQQNIDKVTIYGSKDSKTGELKIMMLNKMLNTPANISANLANFTSNGTARVYQYSKADSSQIKRLADISGVSTSLNYTLDPYSITLVVVNPASAAMPPLPTPTSIPNPSTASFTLTAPASVAQGVEFAVPLKVLTDIDSANVFSAKLSFNPNILQVNRVDSAGSFINNWVENIFDNTTGKISLTGAVPDPGYKTTGSTSTMATVYLQAKTSGSATLSFLSESAIYRNSDNINILATPSNLALNIDPSLSPTPTPTPTSTPTPTAIPTPNATPTPTLTPTTIPSDTQAPTAPGNFTAASVSATSVSLTWSASSDNVGVSNYWIIRDGVTIASVTASTLSYTDSSVSPSTTYQYQVVARDAASNNSSPATASVTTQSLPDSQAPAVPVNLVATAVSSTQINLSWTASTDNTGVTGYEVYRDGVKITTVTTTTFGDSGLTKFTAYSYTVKAVDAAGNASLASSPASATTYHGWKRGDFNNDNKSDLIDLSILMSNWRNPNLTLGIDLINDGVINTFDFSELINILVTDGIVER